MAGAALLCQLDRSLESLSQNTSSVMRSTWVWVLCALRGKRNHMRVNPFIKLIRSRSWLPITHGIYSGYILLHIICGKGNASS